MIKVFSSENRLKVWQIKELLESYQIPCFIKNEYAIGGAGEISPFDAWPEVWLTDEEWLPRATKIMREFEASQVSGPDWLCHSCGEKNEGNFEICWNCGKEARF